MSSLSNYLSAVAPSLWQLFMGLLFIVAITVLRGGVAGLPRPPLGPQECGAVSALLEVEGLGKRFQGLVANADIDFSLARGEIRSVIGPNGAGKTTFISMISGHLAPTTGRIRYKGQDITRLPVVRRARLGIGRKFQTPSLFDNLSAPRERRARRPARAEHRAGASARCWTASAWVPRPARRPSTSRTASGSGSRSRCCSPTRAELVLLDEPTAGMTAEETHATGALIRELARELGLSTIVIEHDINFIRDLAAPVTVLHLGRVLTEGPFEAVADGPAGPRRLPGERLMALEVEGVTAGYGPITVLRDVSLSRGGRRDPGRARPQRHGQVDADPLHLRPDRRRAPARCASRAATSPACRRTRAARLGITTVVQGRGIFPRLSVRENLEMGRIAGGGGEALAPRRGARLLSAPRANGWASSPGR